MPTSRCPVCQWARDEHDIFCWLRRGRVGTGLALLISNTEKNLSVSITTRSLLFAALAVLFHDRQPSDWTVGVCRPVSCLEVKKTKDLQSTVSIKPWHSCDAVFHAGSAWLGHDTTMHSVYSHSSLRTASIHWHRGTRHHNLTLNATPLKSKDFLFSHTLSLNR